MPEANIVLELSKGGCVNLQTRAEWVKNPYNYVDVLDGSPNNIKVIISPLPFRLDFHVCKILADRWNEGQRDLRGKLSECLVSRLSVCVSEIRCERERARIGRQMPKSMPNKGIGDSASEAANSKNLEQKSDELERDPQLKSRRARNTQCCYLCA